MQQNELRVATPKRLAPPPPKRQREKGSRKVAKVKVDGSWTAVSASSATARSGGRSAVLSR